MLHGMDWDVVSWASDEVRFVVTRKWYSTVVNQRESSSWQAGARHKVLKSGRTEAVYLFRGRDFIRGRCP